MTAITEIHPPAETKPKKSNVRLFVAFWLLGLCNNLTFVVMLSAANDIISKTEHKNISSSRSVVSIERHCNKMSTGAILVADVLPSAIFSLTLPFLPLMIHVRIFFLVLAGVISMALTGLAGSFTAVIIGVSLSSASSGLGEITILPYSSLFPLAAVAAWASGSGAAGLLGSFAYAGMTEAGISPQTALLANISAPLMFAVSFWIILDHDAKRQSDNVPPDGNSEDTAQVTVEPTAVSEESESNEISFWSQCRSNLAYIPKLSTILISMLLIYFFQYLSISGLFEQVFYTNTVISKNSQFRWYNSFYRVGVFLSRSSVTWMKFDKIWVFALLQGVTFLVLCMEAVYGFLPNVWTAFVVVLIVGLLSGWAYVNTFHSLSSKVPENKRLFAISIIVAARGLGTVIAGLSAFPLHGAICTLPYEPIFRWPTA